MKTPRVPSRATPATCTSTRWSRVEFAPRGWPRTAASGTTVNAVCPGYVETPLLEASLANITAKTGLARDVAIATLQKHNPQGRFVTPEEVADAVVWLCSPAAQAITGQAISISGGEI